MPREVIWAALFWLEAAGAAVQYVYNRPHTYAEDWLARDPENPRLVYKLAGALEVGRPTALLAVTGFDENRCRQAIEFYEPSRVLLATQRGNQFGNDVRNVGREFNQSNVRIERVEVDSYCGGPWIWCIEGACGGTHADPQCCVVFIWSEALSDRVVQVTTGVSASGAGVHWL